MEFTTNDPYLNAVMVLTDQRNFHFCFQPLSTAYVWSMAHGAVACARQPVAYIAEQKCHETKIIFSLEIERK